MIFNSETLSINEVYKVFSSVKNTNIVLRADNDVRIQGLSNQEVVLAISNESRLKYKTIVIRDEAIVRALRSWYDQRFCSPIS